MNGFPTGVVRMRKLESNEKNAEVCVYKSEK